jgi:transcriptional regulator with XRE-family HTH domain
MKEQELRTVLGKNVKFFRFHQQLSQAALAEKADISITFLSNIERGNNFPKARTLCNLAKSLNVEVYELFKPEIVPDESKDLVERLTVDVRRGINQTLDEMFRRYQT